MRFRGLECVATERYAEAFVARKLQFAAGLATEISLHETLVSRLADRSYESVAKLESSRG